MNRNIKIFLIIASVLILASVLLFFITRKKELVTTSQNDNQTSQNALPVSPPATSSHDNQTDVNSIRENISPSGKETGSSETLDKYGKYAFETFQKYPALVEQIKTLDSSFSPSQMDPSYPSRVYHLDNGKDYLALGGCTEHNCGGTKIIVLYNVTDNKVYMGKENSAQTRLQFFGNPSDQEKNTMTNFYLQK